MGLWLGSSSKRVWGILFQVLGGGLGGSCLGLGGL